MADERRRYLRQQAELGGSEVVLPGPLRAGAVPPPARVPEPDAARAPDPDAVPAARPSPEEDMPKWMKGAPPIPGPGLTVEPPARTLLESMPPLATLDAVAQAVAGCTRCPLAKGRTHAVPGEGNPEASLVLVGEGPGATEDQTGRPFVGAAGELLNDILAAIDLRREDVFIANIVKCRPPQNRKPLPDEAAACLPYLHRQIELIRPTVILALGGTAAESLLGVRKSLGELRGKVHRYGGTPLVVTYHPAALLRNPNWKKPTWDDVRIARQLLDS